MRGVVRHALMLVVGGLMLGYAAPGWAKSLSSAGSGDAPPPLYGEPWRGLQATLAVRDEPNMVTLGMWLYGAKILNAYRSSFSAVLRILTSPRPAPSLASRHTVIII